MMEKQDFRKREKMILRIYLICNKITGEETLQSS